MRVLIATAFLGDLRAGTQTYSLQIAAELLRRGHQVAIFSPRLGATAEEARAAGIQVVANLQEIADAPDVIHGHHHVETITALLHFPRACGVMVCVGARFSGDTPLLHPRVRRYVAIDRPTYERLTIERGVDPSKVEVVLNFVDLRKFKQQPPLPARPHRALVFSNYAGEHSHLPAVRVACEQRGIVLDVVGLASGRQSREPHLLLGQYDLVFAKALSAIEAMAVGAAVIVCDFDGVGPMVSTRSFDELRALNFGYRAQTGPHDPDVVLEQIDRYDPDDARAVSDRVRATANLDLAIDAFERIYRQALAEHSAVPWELELRAAGEYIHWLNPLLREREESLGWAERLLEIAEERNQRIDELTAECERRMAWAESLQETAEERGRLLDEMKTELDRRTDWAEGLLAEADRRGEVIAQLERAVSERTAWAEGLLKTAEARGAVILDLQRALDERGAGA